MSTLTSRIKALRGFCRELGLHMPVGARTGLDAIARAIADDQTPILGMLMGRITRPYVPFAFKSVPRGVALRRHPDLQAAYRALDRFEEAMANRAGATPQGVARDIQALRKRLALQMVNSDLAVRYARSPGRSRTP